MNECLDEYKLEFRKYLFVMIVLFTVFFLENQNVTVIELKYANKSDLQIFIPNKSEL